MSTERRGLGVGAGVGATAPPRPRNTFVPSCRPIQERGAGVCTSSAVASYVPGSGEGQRRRKSPDGTIAEMVEREGCPIKRLLAAGCRCP